MEIFHIKSRLPEGFFRIPDASFHLAIAIAFWVCPAMATARINLAAEKIGDPKNEWFI